MRGGPSRGWPAIVVALAMLAACTSGADAEDEVRAAATTAAPTLDPTTTAPAPPPPTTTTSVVDDATILLAWTSGGLPVGFSAAASQRPEVQGTTIVLGGQADLVESRRADGTIVDTAPDTWAYPLDTLAVAPDTFARFINDPDDRARIGGLQPGQALLTESSAALRRLDVGGALALRGGVVTVVGVISDRGGSEAELLVHAGDAATFGVDTERFVLMVHDPAQRASLDAALVDLAGSNPVHLRTVADTTRFRQGDSVVPLVYIKLAFGEFVYRDRPGRAVEIDPAWVDANIVTARVPILGTVHCNRVMIEPLTAALGQLEAEGLAHVIDPATYAGCWNPRRIVAGMPLSKHSWGIAADVNVIGNPRGTFETQDPRFTQLMRDQGFAWGGDWQVADPAHYELDP